MQTLSLLVGITTLQRHAVTPTWYWVNYSHKESSSMTISATPDENSSPRMPLSSGAEVLWLRTKVSEVATARIEAKASMGNSLRPLWPSSFFFKQKTAYEI